MNAPFCVVDGPFETCTRYEPSSRCHVICAVSCVPSGDTVNSGKRSPARYTVGALPKLTPVSESVSPSIAAVLIASCGGGFFPCAAADVATARAHTRAPTYLTTNDPFRDMRHLPLFKMGG